MPEVGLLNAFNARLMLLLGGLFGWHRLYLRQIPEAFIFMSTAGIFLIGIFYDSFFIHAYVDEHNERFKKKGKNDESEHEKEADNEKNKDKLKDKKQHSRMHTAAAEHIGFSMTKTLCSLLYGTYLGMGVWLAANLAWGASPNANPVLMIAIPATITFGIYIIGNSGGQKRDTASTWIAVFTAFVVSLKLADFGTARSILYASIAGALMANRGAKKRPPGERPYTKKHYIFWSSLWLLCICICIAGGCRHLLERRVAFNTQESRVTSSLATILYDRFNAPHKLHKLLSNPQLTYRLEKPPPGAVEANEFWQELWRMQRGPSWADHAIVFILDILTAEARSNTGKLAHEPLKFAAWRLYLRWTFNLGPLASSAVFESSCAAWTHKQAKNSEKKSSSAFLSIQRACEVSNS